MAARKPTQLHDVVLLGLLVAVGIVAAIMANVLLSALEASASIQTTSTASYWTPLLSVVMPLLIVAGVAGYIVFY
jgi:hypothetical protein